MTWLSISKQEIEKRKYWVGRIKHLSGNFGVDSEKIEQEILQEIKSDGVISLVGHLRLCGAIPENYSQDSSEEKLYSKYTDIVIHNAFRIIGCQSLVLRERSNVADIECICDSYSFVADAKAFRLSRTAKNQKDFKVQAIDTWKYGKTYAMIVCPVYQLPAKASQIYQQATTRSVCICTYTRLATLVKFSLLAGQHLATQLLHDIFTAVETLNPTKSANQYWQAVNRVLVSVSSDLSEIWRQEKIATTEAIFLTRNEALEFLALERQRIMELSREDAIREIIKSHKIDNRISKVEALAGNDLLEVV